MRMKALPGEVEGFASKHALALAIAGTVLIGYYYYSHHSAAVQIVTAPSLVN